MAPKIVKENILKHGVKHSNNLITPSDTLGSKHIQFVMVQHNQHDKTIQTKSILAKLLWKHIKQSYPKTKIYRYELHKSVYLLLTVICHSHSNNHKLHPKITPN